MVELESQTPEGVGSVRFLALLTFAKALGVVWTFWGFHGWLGQLSRLLLLQGVICVVVGGGLLLMKRWAYYVTLLMTLLIALIIVSEVVDLRIVTGDRIVIAVFVGEYVFYWALFFAFYVNGASWASLEAMWLFILAIHVLILAYLLQPRIRKVFGITRFLR